MSIKYIYKARMKNNSGKYTKYSLEDMNGFIKTFDTEQLKSLLRNGHITVFGLKLTKDNRIILSPTNINSIESSSYIYYTGISLRNYTESMLVGKEKERNFVLDINKYLHSNNRTIFEHFR